MKLSNLCFGISFLGMVLFLTSCTSWHYKHARIKIEPQNGIPVEETSNIAPVTPSMVEAATENSVVSPSLNEQASISTDMVANKNTIPQNAQLKHKQKADANYYVQKFDQGRHLFKVKQVENTQLSGWLKIMIILFAVGLILVIFGAIFSAVFFGGFWWFFYLIGSLCILAGFVVLVLGLVGVMN